MNDVTITSTRITLPLLSPQDELQMFSVEVILQLDSIALEANETFSLSFVGDFENNPILRDTLTGTVIDADSK